jgi:peptidyl-prolyl cis-trans isomerase D
MLAAFRHLANTWPARILLVILGLSFASWGIADVVRMVGSGSTAVATVQGHDITPQQFLTEYQSTLRRTSERLPDPSQIPASVKMSVARQTLEKLVTQQAIADEIRALGLASPDDQVRQTVFAMPDFQGPDGKFQRNTLLQVLASNNMSEAHFLDLVRQDVAQNQLLQSVTAAVAPSDLLTSLVFRYLFQKRQADLVTLPFAGQPLPPEPPEATLRRYYDNHPERYTSPEYRHIKAVILSPDSIGRSLTIADADLKSWFDQHRSDFVAPEKRSVQVITADTEAEATALAAQWKAGASWDAMQAAAKAAKASAVTRDSSSYAEVPSPELAKAAFAAAVDSVTGPVKQALGFYVLRVTEVTPARNPSFESLRDTIRGKVAAEKALDLIDARAQKLQDIFAGGARIDEVPADLGATGAAGTLDAKGNTADGTPAPIPAGAEARQQIVDAAFRTNPGDSIQPTEGPDHTWYAIAVDSITKPARKPFEQVRAQVLSDWQQDQIRHRQEGDATRILQLARSGQSLANAAWGTGLRVTRTLPLQRNRPQNGVPAELVQKLFTMKQNEATMVETNAGFVVAQLAAVLDPDPKDDSNNLTQTRDGLSRALHDDYLEIYATALRNDAKPTVRTNVIETLVQQPGE